jgi:hypothetical protein
MKFLATSEFINCIQHLIKKYPTIQTDICKELNNLSFEEIFAKKYILKDSGNYKILKVRISNAQQNKGKSAGFRLILFLNRSNEEVCFLHIFSKIDSEGKDNISPQEIKIFMNILKNERDNDTLQELNQSTLSLI